MNFFDTTSLWFNIAVNYIDWKIWIGIILVIAVLTFQIWGTIWLALPLWMKVTIIFIVVAIGAYFAGRNTGSKNERDLNNERNRKGEDLRNKIDENIRSLDEAALEKRAGRWYRD